MSAFLANGTHDELNANAVLMNLSDDFNKDFLPITTAPPLPTSVMTASMLGYPSMAPPTSDIMEGEL